MIRQYKPAAWLFAWLLAIAAWGCAELKTEGGDDDGSDADADADADADTDTDTDTDTDADTDADADADADTDTDADTDADTDPLPCPYLCMGQSLCNMSGGVVEPLYWCDGTSVCCNTDPDTDTNPVQCIDGPCCAQGQYLGDTDVCDSWVEQGCESDACGGDVVSRTVERRCTGSSSGCDGEEITGGWAVTADCTGQQICQTDGVTASCLSCPYGCVADQCQWVDWVQLTGGLFQMGSSTGGADEAPVHAVNVPAFELGATEVTVLDYQRCVQLGGCTSSPGTGTGCNWNQPGRENHPVNCVTWHQAAQFCAFAQGRLPSEAEWEFAARGLGLSLTYPWGENPASCDLAVMNQDGGGCGQLATWAVCSKTAGNTAAGLCDMAGNAWEWMMDWYHPDYTGAPTDGSAWVVPAGTVRVTRGGGYVDHSYYMRTTARSGALPSFAAPQLGFRCAR